MAAAPVAARAAAARAGAGAAARGGAGKAAAGKTAGKAAGSAAQHAEGIQAIKDARPVTEGSGGSASGEQEAARARAGVMSGPRSLPSITVNTRGGAGGGFVLGMLAYVVGLTYLRGGKPAVKQLLRAKFLNDVSP
jgi:hypothetical protein